MSPYKYLLKSLNVGMCIVLGVLLAISVIGWIATSNGGNKAHHTTTRAAKQAYFYGEIAGTTNGVPGTPGNHLAQDLKARLGPVDPKATTLPSDVELFKGTNNSYGGITQDIGINPFDSTGLTCNECGPLASNVKQELLTIKRGEISTISKNLAPVKYHAPHLTLFGWSFLTEFLVVLLAFGVPLFGIACNITKEQCEQYRSLALLDWHIDRQDGLYKVGIIALAPLFFAFYFPYKWVSHRKLMADLTQKYPEYMNSINNINRVLEAVEPKLRGTDKVKKLKESRDAVLSELMVSNCSGNLVQDYWLEDKFARAEHDINDVKNSIAFRKEAYKELEGDDPSGHLP